MCDSVAQMCSGFHTGSPAILAKAETGGFASPPYDGFALQVRRMLVNENATDNCLTMPTQSGESPIGVSGENRSRVKACYTATLSLTLVQRD